jgi:hypothetical protein
MGQLVNLNAIASAAYGAGTLMADD